MFRTYEIDDAMLGEYGLPTGQQVLGRAETLDEIYGAIIDGKALSVHPEWVSDERMEREAAALPREVMTAEAIARDHGKAVTLDLPGNASKELLQDIYWKAHALERIAEMDAWVAETEEEVEFWLERAEKAAARMEEVRNRESSLTPEALTLEGIECDPASGTPRREVVSAEAIARDPWNAVKLDWPEVPSAELALLVRETAFELRNQVASEAVWQSDPEARQRLHKLWDEAGQRREDAWVLYDKAEAEAKEREGEAQEFNRRGSVDGA